MADKLFPGCGFLPEGSSLLSQKSELGFVRNGRFESFRVARLPGLTSMAALDRMIRPGYPVFGAENGATVDEALRWLAKNQPAALTLNPALWDGEPTELERRLAQMLLHEDFTVETIPAFLSVPPPGRIRHPLQACKIVRMYADLNPTVPLPWRPSAPRPGRRPLPPPTLKPSPSPLLPDPPQDVVPVPGKESVTQTEARLDLLTSRVSTIELALSKLGYAFTEPG
jgi:hypothetical protein